MDENNDNITMSRIAFERMQAKDERNDTWRNVTILVLIVMLVGTNLAWLIAWNSYDYVYEDTVEVEASQDGNGVNIVGAGDIDYGTDSNSTQETESIESTP